MTGLDLIINDDIFDVGVASLKRTIRREEKYNVMTEDGRRHREVRAVYVDFTLEVGNLDNQDYQALMELLSGPKADAPVTVEVDGATCTGWFDGVTDEALFEDDEGLWWDRLSLSFTGTEPLEVRPDEYRFIY